MLETEVCCSLPLVLSYFGLQYSYFEFLTYVFVLSVSGNHALFYAPYSANTGFYYVRNNPKTRHFFNSVLMQGDLIFSTHSHQVPLVALLQEHASLLALKVKIFPRHEDEFPGGHAFHRRKSLMKQIIDGTTQPYIFHMSWTKSKINKIAFFEQLGEWYVDTKCVQRSATKLMDAYGSDVSTGCCSSDALFKCHYSDKPSLHPCKTSPKLDSWARPWWK
jgi:Nucleotide-diphospho-sugar transferase